MSFEYYNKAQKMGIRAYKDSLAHGKYPYLPVLDEILSHAHIDGEIPLGVEDIPLNQVVGTSTLGRTQAFASNFMPLLDENSEFAMKWAKLASYQEQEGIQDPILVYEYMANYYVVEGNKRVSVLKFFQAPTIRAQVIRKLPRRTEYLNNRIYYEYLDFYKVTKINFIRFSRLGSYAKLLSYTGKDASHIWTDDELKDFKHFFSEFEKAFEEKGGNHLQSTVSDALLFFLSLYPYAESKEMTLNQIRKKLDKIWPEILLLAKDDSVELLMNPVTEKKTGTVETVLQKIIPPRKKQVAFVYDRDPSTSDWIYSHELGRIYLQEKLGDSIETFTYIINSADKDADEQMEKVCTDGCDIIFTITPKLIKSCLKAAVAHPQVVMLNCSLNSPHSAVRTYYTRMYEAKFLSGMIAGSMCNNDKIGYVADYPIYGAAASINAFALGAKMVNPRAKVYLAWSTLKDFDVENYFKKENITYISSQDMITPKDKKREFGLYEATTEGNNNLAIAIHQWGPFYEKLTNSILKGSFRSEDHNENKAINYWWGLSANVIDIIYSGKLPVGTTKLIELMKEDISSGNYHPFSGPLWDQDGILRCEASVTFKPEDIVKMDWLSDNIIGVIPTIDQLKDEAKPIVELRGLYKTTVDKGGASLL